MITYRMLHEDEWDRVKDLEAQIGGPVPDAGHAACAIAENEKGQIVGVLFLQPALHLEPLAIDPAHRGQVNFTRLAQMMDIHVQANMNGQPLEYFAFSPDKRVGRMCKLHQMSQLPFRVWHKRFEPAQAEEL